MSRRNRYRHTENNQKGLRGSGPGGACSVTERKTIKTVTSRWRRREHRLYIEEGERDMETSELPKKATQKDDGTWVCKKCGSGIMATQVAHAIHDGPFPLSGSGKCEYEDVPYCPKCETKPSFHGAPIKRSPFADLF